MSPFVGTFDTHANLLGVRGIVQHAVCSPLGCTLIAVMVAANAAIVTRPTRTAT